MALLPPAVVHASVAAEIAAAQAWAARQSHPFTFDADALALNVLLCNPATGDTPAETYLLKGTFEDYRAVAPGWWMAHPETGEDIGLPAYPRSPLTRGGIFIIGPAGPVICAHFNRLAFAANGPHPEWGSDATGWLNVGSTENARAETIADMLARIALDVRESPGRMEPLP